MTRELINKFVNWFVIVCGTIILVVHGVDMYLDKYVYSPEYIIADLIMLFAVIYSIRDIPTK